MRKSQKIILKQKLRAFGTDRHGSIAIFFALLVMLLMVSAGVAVDYARAAGARTALQNELDAAILAGVRKAVSEREAAAATMFDSYPRPQGTEVVSRNFIASSDQLAGEAVATVPTAMLGLIRIDELTVKVTSAAKSSMAAVCILVNNPSASQALLVNSGANIVAPDCEMHIRSTANPAAMINNGQGLNLQRICVKSSKVTQNGGAVAGLETGCEAISNPFEGKLPKVAATSLPSNNCSSSGKSYNGNNSDVIVAAGNYCGGMNFNGSFKSITLEQGNYKSLNIGNTTTVSVKGGGFESLTFNSGVKTIVLGAGHYKNLTFNSGDNVELNPGTFENITFNSGVKTVTLKPGLYIWKGSTMLNSATLKGTGVTIYYPDRNSYIQVNSGGVLDIAAPTTGTYSGILIFEPDGLSASSFSVNGSAKQQLNGLIYWPSRNVTFNSTSTILGDKISLVVDRMTLNGLNWNFTSASKGMYSSSTGPARLLY